MSTALDVNRRGFLGMLFGAAAAVVAAPIMERVAESRWADVLRRIRGIMSRNPVTKVVRSVSAASLADAFAQVERWDLPVKDVYMHPDTYAQLRAEYAPSKHSEIFYEVDGEPRLWGAAIRITDGVAQEEVFVVNLNGGDRGVAEIEVIR